MLGVKGLSKCRDSDGPEFPRIGIVLGLDEESSCFPNLSYMYCAISWHHRELQMLSSGRLWESILYDENTATLAFSQQPVLSTGLSAFRAAVSFSSSREHEAENIGHLPQCTRMTTTSIHHLPSPFYHCFLFWPSCYVGNDLDTEISCNKTPLIKNKTPPQFDLFAKVPEYTKTGDQ